MNAEKLLEKVGKKLPGFAEVGALAVVLTALVQDVPRESLALWVIAVVLFSCWLGYKAGSALDDIVFAPLYGVEDTTATLRVRVWRWIGSRVLRPLRWIVGRHSELNEARQKAATNVSPDGKCEGNEYKGLYKTGAQVFQRTDTWEDKIEPWLKLSKAVRTVVVPLVGLMAYDFIGRWTFLDPVLDVRIRGVSFLAPLKWWWIALGAAIFALIVYLVFRVQYMISLYRLPESSEVFCIDVTPLLEKSPATNGEKAKRRLVCVGSVVIPADEVVFEKELKQQLKTGSKAATA